MSRRRARASALLFAALIESAMGWLFLANWIDTPTLVLIHLAVTVGLGSYALWNRSDGALTLGVLATIGGGPVGACAGAVLCWTTARASAFSPVDMAWRDLLSGQTEDGPEDTLFLQLSSGQERTLLRGKINVWDRIFKTGTMRDRRNLIALITQHYHPSFHRFLDAASRSPSAEVRVQAAAALTVLRQREKARLAGLVLASATPAMSPQAQMRALMSVIAGQLLSSAETHQAERALSDLLRSREIDTALPEPKLRQRIEGLVRSGLYLKASELLDAHLPQQVGS